MAVQAQLSPFAMRFLILVLALFSLSFQALGRLPSYSPSQLIVPLNGGGRATSQETLLRPQFPEDFIFGVGTSAYQVEGGASEGGKGRSIWDTWTHSGHSFTGDTGDVAADEYFRYEEDMDLVADMNMDAYRFSISWPRIFPIMLLEGLFRTSLAQSSMQIRPGSKLPVAADTYCPFQPKF